MTPRFTRLDGAELLRFERGGDPGHGRDREGLIGRHIRLAALGMLRRATRMDGDGREVMGEWELTPAGLSRVAAIQAEARAEREKDAGGAVVAAPEKVAGRERLHRPCPPITAANSGASHDHD